MENGASNSVSWGDPHPGTGERIITITTGSAAEAGPIILRLLNEEPTPGADDLRGVTWDVAVIYTHVLGGFLDVAGHMPEGVLGGNRLYRLNVTSFGVHSRMEDNKKVNDAAAILNALGLGSAPQLMRTFELNSSDTSFTFARSSRS